MSFVERRSADTRRYLIVLFVVLGVVISLVTVVIAQLSWRGWVAGVRALLRGEGILQPFAQTQADELHPLASDLRAMLRDLDLSRRNPDRNTTGARRCCAACCASSCSATRSWSSPTASRSSTCAPTTASWCSGRRADW